MISGINSGITLERTASTYIAATEKLRPTGDKIIVKPLDWNPSKIVIAIREGRPVRGEVLAVGKGAYEKRYSKDRSKVTETENFVPTTVQVGDIVEWGGLNIFDGNGYSFQEIIWGNELCLVLSEKDVCFIRECGW